MPDKKEVIEKALKNSNPKDSQKTQEEILVEQMCEGLSTYDKKKGGVFIGSFTAGLEIGFSFALIAMLHTFLKDKVSDESLPYLTAFAYPVGFILVILGRSLLFTEQTSLLALPVFSKKQSVLDLLRLWGIVILGNIIAGYAIAFIIMFTGRALGNISTESIISIAEKVLHYSPMTLFASAIMAGWLMGLLSWLVTSSNETISRIAVIYIVTLIIGLGGLHHSIVDNIEVFSGWFLSETISFGEYALFELTVLTGNAIGGVVFVGLLRYRAFAANY